MSRRAVFIDRDGTMAQDVHYCSRTEDFTLFPSTSKAIKLLNESNFRVIVVTNQSGIARGYFTRETLEKIHAKMKMELAKDGAHVDAIYYCPHHPDDNCNCRKPKPEMLLKATKDFDIDLVLSFVIGDLKADIDMGKSVNCKTILVSNGSKDQAIEDFNADFKVSDLYQAAQKIVGEK